MTGGQEDRRKEAEIQEDYSHRTGGKDDRGT